MKLFLLYIFAALSSIGIVYPANDPFVTFNVRDFGAIANDSKSDNVAIQNCINEAVKNKNARIIVPAGKYVLKEQLVFNFLDENIEFIGEIVDNKSPEFFYNSQQNMIWVKGFLFDRAQGSFKIENIKLFGNNLPFSSNHKQINKDAWNAGILITDHRKAIINKVEVNNFYGQGIHVSTTKQVDIPLSARFEYVEIKDSKILNVWGFNPKKDNYGDGIYISNVQSALIQDNQIQNRVSVTKQLGRSGIVIEFMAENVMLKNNTIFEGYDRPLHIEFTFGGHQIIGNKLFGSDLGIVLVEESLANYKTTYFSNNYVSNAQLQINHKLSKSYGRNSFGDRSLILVNILKSSTNTRKVIFNQNQFIIDGNYEYESDRISNVSNGGIEFKGNKFEVLNSNKKFYISGSSISQSSNSVNKKLSRL